MLIYSEKNHNSINCISIKQEGTNEKLIVFVHKKNSVAKLKTKIYFEHILSF